MEDFVADTAMTGLLLAFTLAAALHHKLGHRTQYGKLADSGPLGSKGLFLGSEYLLIDTTCCFSALKPCVM